MTERMGCSDMTPSSITILIDEVNGPDEVLQVTTKRFSNSLRYTTCPSSGEQDTAGFFKTASKIQRNLKQPQCYKDYNVLTYVTVDATLMHVDVVQLGPSTRCQKSCYVTALV